MKEECGIKRCRTKIHGYLNPPGWNQKLPLCFTHYVYMKTAKKNDLDMAWKDKYQRTDK